MLQLLMLLQFFSVHRIAIITLSMQFLTLHCSAIVDSLLWLCLSFIMISMAFIKMQFLLHYSYLYIAAVFASPIILCHGY
jgi:hypothetical protein